MSPIPWTDDERWQASQAVKSALRAAIRSQAQLAKTMGVSEATIEAWAAGERLPSRESAMRLIGALREMADRLNMEAKSVAYRCGPDEDTFRSWRNTRLADGMRAFLNRTQGMAGRRRRFDGQKPALVVPFEGAEPS